MKTVGSNREVAEAFVRGAHSFRNGKNTFYCDDGILYSYGPHFPMAIQLDGMWLVNCAHYSPTTNQHFGEFRRAVGYTTRVIPVLSVSHRSDAHVANRFWFAMQLRELEQDSWRRRSEHTIRAAQEAFDSKLSDAVLYHEKFFPGHTVSFLNRDMYVIKTLGVCHG